MGVPPKLDGTLEARLVNGFVPASTDTFQVMTYPSRNGVFANVTGPCTAVQDTTNVTLKCGSTAPVVNAGPDATSNEGASFTQSGTVVDADSTSWTGTVDYGDGSGTQPLTINADKTFTLSHVFADDGSYTVSVTVADAQGNGGADTVVVTVRNLPPTITGVTNNGPIAEGGSATITVAASDPGGAKDPLTYAFDCNNDGTYEVAPPSGNSASCTFPTAGSFTVGVTVADGDGGTATGSTSVTVNAPQNEAPVVTAPANQTANEGAAKSFELGSFADLSTGGPWTVDVDWGDGSAHTAFSVTASGSLGSQTHTYADNRSDGAAYSVSVKVTDKGDLSDSKSFNVTVANVAPAVTIRGAPAGSPEGTAIALDSTVTDPSLLDAFTYAWSATKNGQPFGASGAAASFSLTPDDNGSYVVTLTVTDDDGGRGSASSTIAVTNAPPTITSVTNNGPITAGASATITVAATDPAGPADPLSYEFDCRDDGTYEVGPQSGNTATCAFPAAGEYPVRVRVTDGDDGAATGVTTVTVRPAPGADLAVTKTATPASVRVGSDLTYTVVVTNNGPLPATGATVTDTLTGAVDKLRLQGATSSDPDPDCTVTAASSTGVSVRCNLGDLASGASVTFKVIVEPRATGTLRNSVNVASSVSDPNSANNAAAVDTTVTRR